MKYWNSRIRLLDPYTPGEQPQEAGWIKLNTNENPWPPSPLAIEVMSSAASAGLERYPDPEAGIFREAAARYVGVKRDFIFTGNGSDEILAFAFGAFFEDLGNNIAINEGCGALLFPDITYSFYRIYAELWSIPFVEIPVQENFSILVESFQRSCGGVVLCNPNAPTGLALPKQQVLELVRYHRKRGAIVVVDEAYAEFGAETVADETLNYDNLLVVRTLSKSKSLAGLRAGYAVGDPNLIQGLRRIRNMFNSYTLGSVTQQGAAAALNDTAYYSERTRELISIRAEVYERLTVDGWHVLPSSSNFLFMRCPGYRGYELYEALKRYKVLVRHWDKPRIQDFIRVSIGNREAMDAFCEIAKEIRQARSEIL